MIQNPMCCYILFTWERKKQETNVDEFIDNSYSSMASVKHVIDFVYTIDSTGSMKKWISQLKTDIVTTVDNLQKDESLDPETKREFTQQIMNLSEINSFLNNIILIENLFNSFCTSEIQELPRQKYVSNINTHENIASLSYVLTPCLFHANKLLIKNTLFSFIGPFHDGGSVMQLMQIQNEKTNEPAKELYAISVAGKSYLDMTIATENFACGLSNFDDCKLHAERMEFANDLKNDHMDKVTGDELKALPWVDYR
eukprot:510093_1